LNKSYHFADDSKEIQIKININY